MNRFLRAWLADLWLVWRPRPCRNVRRAPRGLRRYLQDFNRTFRP